MICKSPFTRNFWGHLAGFEIFTVITRMEMAAEGVPAGAPWPLAFPQHTEAATLRWDQGVYCNSSKKVQSYLSRLDHILVHWSHWTLWKMQQNLVHSFFRCGSWGLTKEQCYVLNYHRVQDRTAGKTDSRTGVCLSYTCVFLVAALVWKSLLAILEGTL